MENTMKPGMRRGRILGGLTLLSIVVGLYWGLIVAPPDAYQGDTQRIMYLHIPSILIAYLSFFLVFVGSCLYLWKREKRDDILAFSAAEIGVLFTALTIVENRKTGSGAILFKVFPRRLCHSSKCRSEFRACAPFCAQPLRRGAERARRLPRIASFLSLLWFASWSLFR